MLTFNNFAEPQIRYISIKQNGVSNGKRESEKYLIQSCYFEILNLL